MRNPKVYVKFVSIVYVWLCINVDFVLDVQVILDFLCIVCERFLVKLTFVEVPYKKESKLFSSASCTN
jgi:hypothetical protein